MAKLPPGSSLNPPGDVGEAQHRAVLRAFPTEQGCRRGGVQAHSSQLHIFPRFPKFYHAGSWFECEKQGRLMESGEIKDPDHFKLPCEDNEGQYVNQRCSHGAARGSQCQCGEPAHCSRVTLG